MLSKRRVSQIVEAEIANAFGAENKSLAEERQEALDFFNGRAVGDLAPPNIPNRSRVVSADVEEVIEWILPVLLKTFTQTDEAVRFDPTNREDQDAADQESDVCNYVFYKDNPGFLILYSWFKDALLLKNGYVKTYYDDNVKVSTETYTNVNDMELVKITMDPDVEIEEYSESVNELGEPGHDIKVRITTDKGVVKVDNCPPENVLVNSDHRSVMLTDARFVAHEEIKTASELLSMGISKKVIASLPLYDQDSDDVGRNTVTSEEDGDYSDDPSQRKYRVYDCYLLMDYDEDGYAERRKILYVRGGHVLENIEFDNVPLPSLSPIINPHRHVGRSIFDRIKEIAKQKTYVWRSLMDNLYFQTNIRVAYNENTVDVSEMLINRPGGAVAVDGAPSENIMPLITPSASGSAYQMIEFLDNIRNGRTGIGPESMGQNINLSNDTAHGIERIMTAKEELVGLIARVFAETGVKEAFLQIHGLLIKNQNKKRTIQLRGDFIDIDPSEWKERTSMTVKVGLGTGDQLKKQMAMKEILAAQKELAQGGSVVANEENIYAALLDHAKLAGIDGREYYTDPKTANRQPPPPDPQMELIKAQTQIENRKLEIRERELAIEERKLAMAAQVDGRKQMTDEQKKAHDALMDERKLDLAEDKIAIDAFEAGIKGAI